jgi:hypothetical protein
MFLDIDDLLEGIERQIHSLPPFNPALAYEIPPQVTMGYAFTLLSKGKGLHLHEY